MKRIKAKLIKIYQLISSSSPLVTGPHPAMVSIQVVEEAACLIHLATMVAAALQGAEGAGLSTITQRRITLQALVVRLGQWCSTLLGITVKAGIGFSDRRYLYL